LLESSQHFGENDNTAGAVKTSTKLPGHSLCGLQKHSHGDSYQHLACCQVVGLPAPLDACLRDSTAHTRAAGAAGISHQSRCLTTLYQQTITSLAVGSCRTHNVPTHASCLNNICMVCCSIKATAQYFVQAGPAKKCLHHLLHLGESPNGCAIQQAQLQQCVSIGQHLFRSPASPLLSWSSAPQTPRKQASIHKLSLCLPHDAQTACSSQHDSTHKRNKLSKITRDHLERVLS
jgi:hypothetical protein